MAAKTYLELVNRALLESKVTLDPLTSINFAAPTGSIMYDHFKLWISTAHEELALARPDWHFRQERMSQLIYPRIVLSSAAGLPLVGDVFEGVLSGVRVTVFEVTTEEQIEGSALLEHTLGITYTDPSRAGDFIIGEAVNRISAVPGGGWTFKNWGFYKFNVATAYVQNIVQDSVYIRKIPTEALSAGDNNNYPVVLLPYDEFITRYPYRWIDSYFGTAQAMSQTPQGSFELYPRLDKPYVLNFDFTRTFVPMTLFSDTPTPIPDHFHLYIMWKAVLEYADFDGNTKLFSRARKHVDEYRYWLERDNMPRPTMIPTGFRVV